MNHPSLETFRREYDLARRLGLQHHGISSTASRRSAARCAILTADLSDRRVVKSREVTFAQAFELTYGEPLK
jgi:hypothetical protein